MNVLYPQEHLMCQNYDNSDEPLFENLFLKEGESLVRNVEEAEVIFIMSGVIDTCCNDKGLIYPKDTIILFPPASHVKITAGSESFLIILHIKSSIHLCNIQPLEELFDKNTAHSTTSGVVLPINEAIKGFLNLLSKSLEDGLRCKCFIDLKSKELFYYFRAYYEKELLRGFFAPLFTKDYDFSVFVLQNYRNIKTVQQFADLYGYSLSCFEKQFKKIFKMSAYQWMTKKKSEAIYHDLIYTDLTLIELSDKYEFSSLSQFCDFCKRVFQTSPGKLRTSKNCMNNLRLS